MVKAILFDAFGTLCEICDKRNPYKPIIKVWTSGVAAAYQTLMTKDTSAGALALEAGCSPESIQQIEAGIQAEVASMRLYPEVPAILERLKQKGLKWAIVSNLATPYAEPLLRLLPSQPDVFAWSFAVGYRKPEEGIYSYACKMLGGTPADVLMVGDSLENDYNTPRQLGMQARYLKRSGKNKSMPDCVADLSEILA